MNTNELSMDSYQQLCERMKASYQNHHAEWMKLAPSVLIERAKEIAALQDAREFMAEGRGIDPDGIDYLLTLEDPLQATHGRSQRFQLCPGRVVPPPERANKKIHAGPTP